MSIDDSANFEFPAGSMFWISSRILETISSLDISIGDFEPELGQLDGTLAHALERIPAETEHLGQTNWLNPYRHGPARHRLALPIHGALCFYRCRCSDINGFTGQRVRQCITLPRTFKPTHHRWPGVSARGQRRTD